jgi:hypothetical protein
MSKLISEEPRDIIRLTDDGQAKAWHSPTAKYLWMEFHRMPVRVRGVANKLDCRDRADVDKLVIELNNTGRRVVRSIIVTI